MRPLPTAAQKTDRLSHQWSGKLDGQEHFTHTFAAHDSGNAAHNLARQLKVNPRHVTDDITNGVYGHRFSYEHNGEDHQVQIADYSGRGNNDITLNQQFDDFAASKQAKPANKTQPMPQPAKQQSPVTPPSKPASQSPGNPPPAPSAPKRGIVGVMHTAKKVLTTPIGPTAKPHDPNFLHNTVVGAGAKHLRNSQYSSNRKNGGVGQTGTRMEYNHPNPGAAAAHIYKQARAAGYSGYGPSEQYNNPGKYRMSLKSPSGQNYSIHISPGSP